MPIALNARTAVLGAVALALAAATAYDLTVGFGDVSQPGRAAPGAGNPVPGAGQAARAPQAPPAEILAREVAELEHFLAAAPLVRSRYQVMAVPYAEAVATFATLHGAGDSLPRVARARVAALLPRGVKLEEMLVSEAAAADSGATWLSATLNLSSDDSAAFETALIRLGEAANGMVWKELAVVSDPERRSLRASGQLALLMVRQAE